MKNKVLVELLVPDIEKKYNIFIPLNKTVGNVIILLSKSISELNNNANINFDKACLYNSETCLTYKPEQIIRESNIRNGSVLILM